MDKKLILVAPCLVLLAACGGSETSVSTPPPVTIPENAPERSVVLTADSPAEASSPAELISINFADSEVGSSVQITEGDFSGVTISKVAPIGGKDTVSIATPDNVEISTALVGTIEDELKVTIQFITSLGDTPLRAPETINGAQVSFYTEINSLGTTEQELNEISIGDIDNGVSATVSITEIAGDTSVVVGAKRYFEATGATDNYQVKTTGEYIYTGLTTVFGYEDSYTTNSATMTVDFENSDGTFTADDFTPDESAPSRTITASSALTLNNETGFISSSSGTLTVDGDPTTMAINGVLSEGNDAAAGAIIITEGASGLIGGVFALPRNP